MMPPEFEKPVSKSFQLDPTRNIETQKIHNGIRHLQLAESDFSGFTSAMAKNNNNFAPKGSLV
jgi:hypothetical protein